MQRTAVAIECQRRRVELPQRALTLVRSDSRALHVRVRADVSHLVPVVQRCPYLVKEYFRGRELSQSRQHRVKQRGGRAVIDVAVVLVRRVHDAGLKSREMLKQAPFEMRGDTNAAIRLAPKLHARDAKNCCRVVRLRLTPTCRLLGSVGSAASLSRAEEDCRHRIPARDVSSDGSAAPDGLIIGMGADDEHSIHAIALGLKVKRIGVADSPFARIA